MHQGMCSFPATAGAKAFYRVSSPTANSTVFSIVPVPARSPAEVFAVFGAPEDSAVRILLAPQARHMTPRCSLPPPPPHPQATLG